MGISNLTSSIRGVTGTEKITGIQKIVTTTIVAANASIVGVTTTGGTLAETRVIMTASTGGSQTAFNVNASRNGTLTNSGALYGQETYVEASIVNSGKTLGIYGIYGQTTNKDGTLLWNNAGFTYSKTAGGTSNFAYGHEAWVEVDGGSIGTGYGFHTYMARTSGTFSNAIGFSADIDGVIGNAYGVKVDLGDVTGNIWGIYTEGETKNYLSGNLQVEGGVITVGSVDAVTGALVLFGNGDQTGGRITLHSGANLDATINSYTMLVGQDDFRIGPAANASALMYRGLDNYWVLNAPMVAASGTLDVGIDDTRRGMVTLFGDTAASTGGTIRMHLASPLAQGTRQWYEVNVYEDVMTLGDNVEPSESVVIDGNTLKLRNGSLEVGESDLKRGAITCQSNGAGNTSGGRLGLLVSPDYDTSIQSYGFEVVGSNLELGPNNDANSLTYRGDAAQWDFTSNSGITIGRGTGYINMNASAGFTGYGIRDNGGVMEFKNSAGTWAVIS